MFYILFNFRVQYFAVAHLDKSTEVCVDKKPHKLPFNEPLILTKAPKDQKSFCGLSRWILVGAVCIGVANSCVHTCLCA